MDEEKDSLRFYYLGNNYETKIEHFGAKADYEPEGLLMVWACEGGVNIDAPPGSHRNFDALGV